jgi:hypothetical protein
MNLLQQLAEHYPDWRDFHRTPIEAAVEIGLLDESALHDDEYPELLFDSGDFAPLDDYEDYMDYE